MLTVKCISNRLNHIAFETDGGGVKRAHKIVVGDTFKVKAIPAAWVGLVEAVATKAKTKVKVTNPAKGAQGNPDQDELDYARLEYEEAEGKQAPADWGVEAIKKAMTQKD